MPIYEYACPVCDARVGNQIVPIEMRDMLTLGCPNGCGAMRRVLSAPAFVVGGVGAYKGPASAPLPKADD